VTPARKPQDIDAYIAGFPADVQAILLRIRATVAKAAPARAQTKRRRKLS
jgi:hypothetical protein